MEGYASHAPLSVHITPIMNSQGKNNSSTMRQLTGSFQSRRMKARQFPHLPKTVEKAKTPTKKRILLEDKLKRDFEELDYSKWARTPKDEAIIDDSQKTSDSPPMKKDSHPVESDSVKIVDLRAGGKTLRKSRSNEIFGDMADISGNSLSTSLPIVRTTSNTKNVNPQPNRLKDTPILDKDEKLVDLVKEERKAGSGQSKNTKRCGVSNQNMDQMQIQIGTKVDNTKDKYEFPTSNFKSDASDRTRCMKEDSTSREASHHSEMCFTACETPTSCMSDKSEAPLTHQGKGNEHQQSPTWYVEHSRVMYLPQRMSHQQQQQQQIQRLNIAGESSCHLRKYYANQVRSDCHIRKTHSGTGSHHGEQNLHQSPASAESVRGSKHSSLIQHQASLPDNPPGDAFTLRNVDHRKSTMATPIYVDSLQRSLVKNDNKLMHRYNVMPHREPKSGCSNSDIEKTD